MAATRSTSSANYEAIRKLALALPGVEESTSYGTPAFKVKARLFIRLRDDIDSIVLKMPFERRDELMASDPETYYITDHYAEYPWVLVRLAAVKRHSLLALVRAGYDCALLKTPTKRKTDHT